MTTSLQHHFLIAMPSLMDSFFYQSVVYLCEHNEEGAMGLIINRPTQVMLPELLSHLKIDNESDAIAEKAILFGGPVEKGQGMVLHSGHDEWKTSMILADNIILTTSTDILETIGTSDGPKQSLITLGYAGWGEGQLEQEIAENSWLTVPANEDILFSIPTEDRWQAAAELLGVDIHLMSNNIGHA